MFVVLVRGTPQWCVAAGSPLFTRLVVSWLSPSHFNLNANFINLPLKRQILVSKPKRDSCFFFVDMSCRWRVQCGNMPISSARQGYLLSLTPPSHIWPHLTLFLRITPNRTSLRPHMLSFAHLGPPAPALR